MSRDNFPSIVESLILVVILMALEYVLSAAFWDLRRGLGLTRSQLEALTMLLANGLVFAGLLHFKSLSYRSLIHSSPISVISIMLLVVVPVAATVPALLLLNTYFGEFLVWVFPPSLAEQQAFDRMSANNLATHLSVCVLAPILEEMLFRGLFLRSFLVRYHRGIAISASALIFGIAHLNIYQFCVAYVLGLYSGWLYERTRSLFPCIALHMLYNTALTVLDSGGEPGLSLLDASAGDVTLWVWVFGVAGVVWLYGMLVWYPAQRPLKGRA